MKEEPLRLPPCISDTPLTAIKWKSRSKSPPSKANHRIIHNKLADQDKSFFNRTYTIDTNKHEREKEFGIEDAIRGFTTRASSCGPRRRSAKLADEGKRSQSEKSSVFSSTCKLPSLNNNHSVENKMCTSRPWTRTQEELKKYKESLKNT